MDKTLDKNCPKCKCELNYPECIVFDPKMEDFKSCKDCVCWICKDHLEYINQLHCDDL